MLWYNTITGPELHDHVHKIQHMSCKLSCSDKPEHLEDEDGCSSWAVFTLWVRAAGFFAYFKGGGFTGNHPAHKL